MKKKWILIIVAVLCVALIAGIVVFCFIINNSKLQQSNRALGDALDKMLILRADQISELQEQAGKCNVTLFGLNDSANWGADKVAVGDAYLSVFFSCEDDTVIAMSSKIEFDTVYDGDSGALLLEDDLFYALGMYSSVLGTDLSMYIKAFHISGQLLDVQDTETYEQMLDGNAYMTLIVKENANCYWKIMGSIQEDGLAVYLDRVFENVDDERADLILE